jgi:hypothetical protein
VRPFAAVTRAWTGRRLVGWRTRADTTAVVGRDAETSGNSGNSRPRMLAFLCTLAVKECFADPQKHSLVVPYVLRTECRGAAGIPMRRDR